MNGEGIICVLCNPEESANIGSVCRAMKTMGLSQLRIVGQKAAYDENRVHTLALAAFDLWEKALFFNSLREAVADCAIAAGTTRRIGKKRKERLLLPDEFAAMAARLASQNGAPVAVVFGNERTGLTDSELECCTAGLTIPSNPACGSLNLSHAVQLIAWELFKISAAAPQTQAAPVSRQELAAGRITDSLEKIGLFKIAGKTAARHFWRDLFSRAGTSEKELEQVEKTFAKIIPLAEKYGKKA